MSGREAAKHLIRTYVERGDSLESLRAGYLGASMPQGYHASISGYLPDGDGWKRWSTDWITVRRDMDGREVNQAFRLQEIYNELKQGQQTLL